MSTHNHDETKHDEFNAQRNVHEGFHPAFEKTKNIRMKKNIVLLVMFSLGYLFTIAQKMNTYDSHWKEIDSLLQKEGRAKSALTLVDQVYKDAKKSANQVQMVKALLYSIELNKELMEDATAANLIRLEEEASTAGEPVRSILNSIAAESYWQYLQMNRWKLYDRTATTGFKKDDLATWGLEDLHAKISSLFLASLKEKKLLQGTTLDTYEAILNKGNARYLRPTLYDLLAHRALIFFENNERDITRPAYAFEIRDPAAFAKAAEFTAYSFPSSDSLSNLHKALELYQQLIAFHLKDTRPDALLDADIKRIQFVYTYGLQVDKDSLYREALTHIVRNYPQNPTAAQAMFLLASWHLSKAETYDPLGDTTHRYARLEAKRICEQALLQADSSEGRQHCANLLRNILQKTISIEAETVTPPGSPFRMLVSYKNLGNTYFRLIRFDEQTNHKYGPGSENWKDEYWEGVATLPAVDSFQYHLPETGDHQEHRTEIKLNALPIGEYALLVSANPHFGREENTLALQYFYVSNIAYVNNGSHYYVLNRSTGAPLASARVQRWQEEYNYQQKSRQLRKTGLYVTDKNGYFRIADTIENRNTSYRLEISYGKNRNADRLFLKETEYLRVYNANKTQDVEKKQAFLFTDRSIYRPAQIVYFKGIVVAKQGEKAPSTVVSNAPATVTLYNANNEPIDSLLLNTNAFGSYSGKFNLPSGTLNGYFSIRDSHNDGALSFRVEEYKRPQFYTEIAKPTGTYRLEDSVVVEGFAKSYAGNAIDGAGVAYRVVRKTIMPLWARSSYLPRIWPPFPQQQTEIAHGTTTTDASGKFIVQFHAIPDHGIPQEQSPLFFYEINANVTDINGETRSALTTVSIGYQSLKLQLSLPEQMVAGDLEKIAISTTNMNDVFEKTEVAVEVYPLQAPSRIFRKRYWQQPDQFLMEREEYYRLFPYDAYDDEQDMTKWPRGKSQYSATITTEPGTSLTLPDTRFGQGWYAIEAAATDKDGKLVKDLRYFRVDGSALPGPAAAATLRVSRDTAQPGDKVTYRLITNQQRPFVVYELTGSDTAQREVIRETRGREHTAIITAAHRGRLSLSTVFVKHNRIYTDQKEVEVPFFDKQLHIDYTSFRNKTLPGTAETWQVKISGREGEKAAAELLTAMYDASLDQFTPHQWRIPGLWAAPVRPTSWSGVHNFKSTTALQKIYTAPLSPGKPVQYDQLGIPNRFFPPQYKRNLETQMMGIQSNVARETVDYDQSVSVAYEEASTADTEAGAVPPPPPSQPTVTPRTDLRETAFFFPDLQTDTAGNISFSFTTPEALTEWRWMLLAHTKELAFGYGEKTMVTQKQLMIQPNAPRFLREGDRIDFSTKVVNMTDFELSGRAILELFDPASGETVDGIFHNISPAQFFTTGAQQSTAVNFSINIPFQYNRPVGWRIVATANSPDSGGKTRSTFSDGEENMLPVISNRMLVTETLPLPVKGETVKKFSFDKLLKSGSSETLQQYGITVEFTSNPAWYAVQALPYLAETTIENAEQIFNRYYANALAAKIANTSARFREVMEQWKKADTASFLSQLQKNEALKSVLLQETPWVLEAKTETQQKKNIALLFDMINMSTALEASLAKLRDMQAPTGGFVWFKGGPEDRYMTQYILTGLGRLQSLGALPEQSPTLRDIIRLGISYLDREIKKEYEQLTKDNKEPKGITIGYLETQYLYMRSFFSEIGIPANILPAYSYFRTQSQQSWVKQNSYMRAMIALSLFRTGDVATAKRILTALRETAIEHHELGLYWKDMSGGYYWYQAPIASQAVMIEAFGEVTQDIATVNGIKTWLLKNKQTRHWKSSKATADACYALLLQGSDWMADQPPVTISMGQTQLHSSEAHTEAGTGYFSTNIAGGSVVPSMGNITVKLGETGATGSRPAWGAVYWQYFEDLDKITPASTPLQLSKKLFVVKNTDRGPVLQPLDTNNTLQPGDRLKVRIELRADRAMEYLHMKDMRAAGTEPINVLSRYKWQGGLGYYETTRDASTDFFFHLLPKGVYVFEYELNVTHTGTFSNGVTSIQCLYAPEFSSHSEGIKINVTTR